MSKECVSAWCSGDGFVHDPEKRPQGLPDDFTWPPLSCKPCREWNNPGGRHRPTFVVHCVVCREKRHFTGGRQVWLKKRVGVPAPEIERGAMCPRCLEASEEERATRSRSAIYRIRKDEGRERVHSLLQFSRGELAAKGAARRAEGLAYWRNRFNDALGYVPRPVSTPLQVRNGRLEVDMRRGAEIDLPRLGTLNSYLESLDADSRAGVEALFEHGEIDHGRLVSALGRDDIDPSLALAVPKALVRMMEAYGDPVGLSTRFPTYRGKGATSWLDDMASKSKGNGPAYEMVGSVALMAQGSTDSLTGSSLQLFPLDQPTFGEKIIAKYVGESTVEADLMITRGNALSGYDMIGVDFKFRSSGSYYAPTDFERQLSGVVSSLRDGQLTEFHFVSNTTFAGNFREAVIQANKQLEQSSCTQIRLHENVTWR